MAVHLLPLKVKIYDYTFDTVLDGTQYGFRVYWNDRDLAWYFDIEAANGSIIAQGIKIVIGDYLGSSINLKPFTNGVFVAVDTANPGRACVDAKQDDMGSRVLLYWVPSLDLMANDLEYKQAHPNGT